MSFKFSQFALFAAFFIGLIACSTYRIMAVRRSGVIRFLRGLLFTVKATIGTMSKLGVRLVGLLASSAVTSEEDNDVSAGAYRGGTLNYRTGKLDDGTDSYGWYEKE